MQTKKCGKCLLVLPISAFGNNRSKSDGKQNYCRSCRKQYLKQHYDNNKLQYYNRTRDNQTRLRQLIQEHKSNLSCSICGFNANPIALDFHHPDENKEANIADIVKTKGWGWTKILHEINKCIVLCANCHRILHYQKTLSGE